MSNPEKIGGQNTELQKVGWGMSPYLLTDLRPWFERLFNL